MNSPRRKHDRPIESVELKITFSGDRETNDRIKELIPTAVVRGRVCEVRIQGERPGDVAEKARAILEKIRTVV